MTRGNRYPNCKGVPQLMQGKMTRIAKERCMGIAKYMYKKKEAYAQRDHFLLESSVLLATFRPSSGSEMKNNRVYPFTIPHKLIKGKSG